MRISFAAGLGATFAANSAHAQLASVPRRRLELESESEALSQSSTTIEEGSSGSGPEEIINGNTLPKGDRPYLITLGALIPGLPYQHGCGATLIGRRTVLSAARKYRY